MSTPEKMKFVLSGIGSRGDTNALMWLAAELQNRGHRCHLLATDALEAPAAQAGVPLTVVAPAQENNLVTQRESFTRYALPTFGKTIRFIEQQLSSGEQLVVINRSRLSPTALCCERFGLPQIRTYIAPSQLRSCVAPPWPWRGRAQGHMGALYKKYWLPRVYDALDATPEILPALNRQRAIWGLAPLASMSRLDDGVTQFLGFFPSWYAKRAKDWHPIELVGFPVPREAFALPPRLKEFLERHGPPLVFTPGTAVTDTAAFFRVAAECCRRLKLPGVFLSKNYALQPDDGATPFFHANYLPLEAVLPRSRLLVHHGGVGTTARALQAGLPQVILPHAYDQPDNGARVADLGVGGALSPFSLSSDSLARMVQALLGNPCVSARLREISTKMNGCGAIERAADCVESWALDCKKQGSTRRVGG